MNCKKIILAAALCLTTYQAHAYTFQDVVNAACVFIGLSNPTEMIDGVKHEIVSSYQAASLITQLKDISENVIVYKHFKTTDEIIMTKHIVDGTVFMVGDIVYVVRSSLHNYNKTYATQKTFFGSQQIVIDSQEGIAIMNDAKSLSYVSIQITGFVVQVAGKIKHGDLADGSSFTANGINYVVRSSK